MSFGHLKLAESLRPWHAAGLRFLFPESGQAATDAVDPTCEAASPAAAAASSASSAAEAAETGPELPAAILQQLYAKVCAPCYSVWTYWDLGEDLLMTPSQQRRANLAALMRSLAWPKGSITFWPVAIPVAARIHAYVPVFWQAIAKIQPQLIAIFGDAAYSALAPQTTRELFHCEGASPVLVPLPDLADLSTGSTLSQQTYATLQNLRPGP